MLKKAFLLAPLLIQLTGCSSHDGCSECKHHHHKSKKSHKADKESYEGYIPPIAKNFMAGVTVQGKDKKDLMVAGMANLTDQSVEGTLTVNGMLEGKNLTINNLVVRGMADINKSRVNGTSSIYGLLTANKTTFADQIDVYSDQINFSDATIPTIIVHPSENFFKKQQKIKLQGATTVTGTITFEDKNGKVIASAQTKITKEQVIGGELIRK